MNILIKLNKKETAIEDVRLLGFGHMTRFEQAEKMNVPDMIDHLPPGFLTYMKLLGKFSSENEISNSS